MTTINDFKWLETIRANALGFQWCLKNAVAALQASELNDVMAWCSLAAHSAANNGFHGLLASPELDDVLLQVAQRLPAASPSPRNFPPRRCLHVFSTAFTLFGHTKLCREWMKLDAQGRQHSVVLLSQERPAPENLVEIVRRAGGSVIQLDCRKGLVERAQEFRAEACQRADVVILHTHPEDVIAPVAFGVPGGPPVIMVNHADHAFWVGRPMVDLLLDIRESGHAWSLENRAVSRAEIVPIPLSDLDTRMTDAARRQEIRQAVRRELGVPEDAVLLLTVGASFKYTPFGDFDFCRAAEAILESCPKARLVAIGPQNTGRWRKANKATNGRLMAIGNQTDLPRFHAAADIYLEGFPSGSLTALLEAAQAGLPAVRAPETCALPFRSDGIALSVLAQPKDLDDYKRMAVALVNNPDECKRMGEAAGRSVPEHHCGESWLNHLRRATARLPREHAVYRDPTPVPVEDSRQEYCLGCRSVLRYGSATDAELVTLLVETLRRGFRTRVALDEQFFKQAHEGHREFNASSIQRRAAAEAKAMEAFEAFDKGETGRALWMAGKCCLRDPAWLRDESLRRVCLRSLIGVERYQWLRDRLHGPVSKG